MIAGANAATTFATLTVTGATIFTGNVSYAAGMTITQSTLNADAFTITGNGTGYGLNIKSGVSGTEDMIMGRTGILSGNISGAIGSLGATAKSDVNAEVDTALADVNLDHIAGTATAIPAIPAGTYIDQMMDDGTAVYDRTTDSLQAVRDRGDAAWITGATPAQVNAEVLDVLNIDTFAEPGQEIPGATVSLVKKIGYIYKAFRNKFTQDATTAKLYADDGTTVDQKATVSDDATTFTRGEMGTGP